ncbi:MAG: metal ABC transporter permease [Planctomycetota bacterium]|nr:MAG: metal ABC transporter permease [Planctomycetota bacterium]
MIEQIAFWWPLLREGILASLLVGLVLPLAGALMYLRRSAFLGVAVPQFSAAGLAVGLWVMPFLAPIYDAFLEHGHPPMLYLFGFAVLSAGLALFLFAWLAGRSPDGHADSRLAAGFATATAVALLFLDAGPASGPLAETILRGEVLLLDRHGLEFLALAMLLVLAGLAWWRKPFVLLAFDPEAAVAQGHRTGRLEQLQILLLGLAIGGGVMTVGPVLVFGLLFLPPLAARMAAGNLRSFLFHSVLVGLLAVIAAWPLSVALDAPYGPVPVVVALVLVGFYALVGALR